MTSTNVWISRGKGKVVGGIGTLGLTHKYTTDTVYNTGKLMRIYLKYCDDLHGKEVQKGGDICICMANSLCYTAEANTTL